MHRLWYALYMGSAFIVGAQITSIVFTLSTPKDPAPVSVEIAFGILLMLMLEKLVIGAVNESKSSEGAEDHDE